MVGEGEETIRTVVVGDICPENCPDVVVSDAAVVDEEAIGSTDL